MRIKEQNLELLRKMVRDLQEENKRLKSQLKSANIPYEEFQVNNEKELTEYDLEQGDRIEKKFITEQMANLFFSMFWGRTDVYAKRGKKGGYFPQCANRWNQICPKQNGKKFNCTKCEYKEWISLTLDKIVNHLIGYKDDFTDVIGVYPLLPDGTCRFLVFDFDNHLKENNENDYANENDEWKEEKLCQI